MDEKTIERLDDLILNLSMDLNVLYNALENFDNDDLDICAASVFAKRLYLDSEEIYSLF